MDLRAPCQTNPASPLRLLAATVAAVAMLGMAAGCGDDDSAQDTTTTAEATSSTDAVDPQDEVVDEAEGTFELTTSDGSIAVAGTTDGCIISGDRESVELTFTSSAVDVDVVAGPGGGTVTIVGQFEGAVEALTIDEDGAVTITGRGGVTDDSVEPTTFEVEGTCP